MPFHDLIINVSESLELHCITTRYAGSHLWPGSAPSIWINRLIPVIDSLISDPVLGGHVADVNTGACELRSQTSTVTNSAMENSCCVVGSEAATL